MNAFKILNHFLLKHGVFIHDPVSNFLWCQQISYPEDHVQMKGKSPLLLYCSIVSRCFSKHAFLSTKPFSRDVPYTKNMFYKRTNHKMKEACTCHWIFRYQTKPFIIHPNYRIKGRVFVCKVEAYRMLVVSR